MPYNAKEIAKLLNIGESTARMWANQFDIPKLRGEKAPFPEEALEVFLTIKSLRDKHHGVQTIKQKIKSLQSQTSEPAKYPLTPHLKHELKTVVSSALESVSSLAEKYARAMYELGQLQEQAQILAQQKLELAAALESLQKTLDQESQEGPWQNQLQQQRQQIIDQQALIGQLQQENQRLNQWVNQSFLNRMV